jgi:hypothetical protein
MSQMQSRQWTGSLITGRRGTGKSKNMQPAEAARPPKAALTRDDSVERVTRIELA